jgi:acyl-CoA oxidase
MSSQQEQREQRWRRRYEQKLDELLRTRSIDYRHSSEKLSILVKSGLLEFTDLQENPERFFEAHRLLVRKGFSQGPGFSIRFTVEYNLFGGTILELGNDSQRTELEKMRQTGELGCFALTEKLAGVNSGLVVQTTCTWSQRERKFTLRTPNESARKVWISQGLVATRAVVIADLIVRGKSHGPHAFLVSMRKQRNGPLNANIKVGDMGDKTTGNDLDNAWIEFQGVKLTYSSLLDKHDGIDLRTGAYVHRDLQTTTTNYSNSFEEKHLTNMDRIGQRLYTGRVAVAQGAHEFRKRLFHKTKAFTDQKETWSFQENKATTTTTTKDINANNNNNNTTKKNRKNTTNNNDRKNLEEDLLGNNNSERGPPLSQVPQLRHLFIVAREQELKMDLFLSLIEKKLCATLRKKERASKSLVEAIAAAKILAVEDAIDLTHRLRQETGSYALMAHTGFEHSDFLICCKFAEGDSRILELKLARDRVKTRNENEREPERIAREKLIEGLRLDQLEGMSVQKAWRRRWREAYDLAEIAARGIVDDWNEQANEDSQILSRL